MPALLCCCWLVSAAPVLAAGFVDSIFGSRGGDASGVAQLDQTALLLARRPQTAAGTSLAARVSQEGHWTFVNMAGETFTAASAGEVKRAFEILLPDLGQRRPAVYVTGDTLFERSGRLVELPRTAELWLALGGEIYRLIKQDDGPAARYLTELKPNLLIELRDAAAFDEALLLLATPLDRQAFRILSIETGGPRVLPKTPRVDRATGRADIDAIDPSYLIAAIRSMRGQTAVLVGRLDGDALSMLPAIGPEQVLKWSELAAAAAASDVNLMVLKSSSGQQPGGRNWLWFKREVKGLETALGHATLANFFDALGEPGNRLVLALEQPSSSRTTIDLRQATGAASSQSSTAQIGSVLSDVVSGLAGKVVHQGAVADFRSAGRDIELGRRIMPLVPSVGQWVYGGLMLIGLLGAAASWRWWARVWPREKAIEYDGRIGYWAARIVRGVVFAVLFMPMVAPAAAATSIMRAFGRISGRAAQSAKLNA